jgi:hypothetical protein
MTPSSNHRGILRVLLLIFVSLAVGLAAITSQSLWMDEGSAAFKALMPTLKDWWWITMRLGGSDTQMPVYMVLLWGWAKLGFLSEFALRSINLPWLIIAVLALRRVRFWPLVCLVSPFVLYYTGELRPYAMQIAGGALAAAALTKIIDGRNRRDFTGLHAVAAASLLLACSSLTAAVWAAGLWVGVLIIRPDWLGRTGFWFRSIPWLVASLTIGGYYLFTLLKGFRATGIEGNSVLSVFFGFYEMLGLLGLGPGRNELRASPTAILHALPLVIPALVCIAGAWFYGVRSWLRSVPPRCAVAVACAVLLPILVLTVVGLAQDFRVLGRHLSPAMPAVLLPIAAAFTQTGPSRLRPAILATLATAFMLASSISLRFLERHARDDYRKATAFVIQSLKQSKTVWLQADMNATRYYAYREGGMPLVNAIQILQSEPPSGLMFADVVVINRPDLRFRDGKYRDDMKRNSFKPAASFTGFEIWTTGD